MDTASILIFFGPNFLQFGCDIAKRYLAETGPGKVHGVCMGEIDVFRRVKDVLGEQCGELCYLREHEDEWMRQEFVLDDVLHVERDLGVGAFGRILVADRRVSRGFVRGAMPRPDRIGSRAVGDPIAFPQQYIAQLYKLLKRMVQTVKPEIVFCYAVACAPAVILAELCALYDIPFTTRTSTRIRGHYVIDTDYRGQLLPVARRYNSVLAGAAIAVEYREAARSYIREFREKPVAPGYAQRRRVVLKKNTPLRSVITASKYSVLYIGSAVVRRRFAWEALARLWFNVFCSWNRFFMLNASKLFSKHLPADQPFIYFPLQVEPESSTMVRAPLYTDQLAIVEALSKSAPAEMVIVVKENPLMVGVRSRAFYKALKRLPRVWLIGPEHDSLHVIRQAALTVVISGTSAWEAMLLKKPAMVIGSAPCLALDEGVLHESRITHFAEAITKALSMPPVSEKNLETYVAACLEDGFEMPVSLISEDYNTHSREIRESAVTHTVAGIIKRRNEYKERA